MPNDPLARYHFTDEHCHPLENCVEYRELLAEVERLREEHAWLLQEVAKINRTPVYCPMPDRYECLYHVGDECRSNEDEMRVGCWRTAVECAVKCGETNNAERP